MTARAVVYSQPGCQPCRFMEKMLDKHGIPWSERNVREDEAAYAELVEFHEACAPDRHLGTPLVVIDDADGHGSRELLFGPAIDELTAMVRDGRILVSGAA